MIIKADRLADLLRKPGESDPLVITPQPNLAKLESSGSASVDLRLGTWFVTLRQSRTPSLDVTNKAGDVPGESRLTRRYYVPFGQVFYLHPHHFVLGVTLEWIRLPKNIAGYVVGKSGWGRRGLIIATAVGVHPGFAGCLTLELTNVGEIPIAIRPGLQICQLFLHDVHHSASDTVDRSVFVGQRRPVLGEVSVDDIARKLGQSNVLSP
jgi:dCTP deaminase